jgi:hypothetical protein
MAMVILDIFDGQPCQGGARLEREQVKCCGRDGHLVLRWTFLFILAGRCVSSRLDRDRNEVGLELSPLSFPEEKKRGGERGRERERESGGRVREEEMERGRVRWSEQQSKRVQMDGWMEGWREGGRESGHLRLRSDPTRLVCNTSNLRRCSGNFKCSPMPWRLYGSSLMEKETKTRSQRRAEETRLCTQ